MRVFRLRWNWYDSDRYWLYTHYNDDKTKLEFEEDVVSLLIKYGNEYIDQTDCWTGAGDWIEYISTKLSELGYSEVEPDTFNFWNADIFKTPDEYGEDGSTEKWGKIVGKELLDKAIAHNIKIRDEILSTIQ